MSIKGFYAGYFSGDAGNGVAMFYIDETSIAGADIAGVAFDGTIKTEGERLQGEVTVTVPPGVTVVQGFTAPPQGFRYTVPIDFPEDFERQPYMTLRTQLGEVNVRMVKVRDLQ